MEKISVACLDDDILVHSLVNFLPNINNRIINPWNAFTVKECIELFYQNNTDVLIIDYLVGSEIGIKVVDLITNKFKKTKIVLFSAYVEEDIVKKSSNAVSCFLKKGENLAETCKNIERIYDNSSLFKQESERKEIDNDVNLVSITDFEEKVLISFEKIINGK